MIMPAPMQPILYFFVRTFTSGSNPLASHCSSRHVFLRPLVIARSAPPPCPK